ncbi:MAG: hypothetical protein OXG10_02265 [Candidatus Dadabacteria bacterium]|nr:hypothetical protein [Candidatus Dadabacteria bacterium]
MFQYYESLRKQNRGAWIVHHGQKTSRTTGGSAEFPALDTAGKAASLLSQLAATDQTTLSKNRVISLGRAAGLNPNLDLPPLLAILSENRVIDMGESGDVEVLGLTSSATVQHASDIFHSLSPSTEEKAAIALAEITSEAPRPEVVTGQFIGDEFQLTNKQTKGFLRQSELFGFVDAEGHGDEKVLFNGNLFRRDNITKTMRIIDSLTDSEANNVRQLNQLLEQKGCLLVDNVEEMLGDQLFAKLQAAGMYDVNQMSNPSGQFGFVTRPAAFHKYNDPIVDDAFDLAKALVSALTYGMTKSAYSRGRITMVDALLRKLIAGHRVGPATAIGEDYQVLEMKGVIKVTRDGYGYIMELLKQDIGEMALSVLTTGEASSTTVLNRLLPGSLTAYIGPETTRENIRKLQRPRSKRLTLDVLTALRTEGGL